MLDHVYESKEGLIQQLKLTEPHFGDHKLLTFQLYQQQNIKQVEPIIKRNWTRYTKDHLTEKLSNEDWNCERKDAQSYFNWMESKLILGTKQAPYDHCQAM